MIKRFNKISYSPLIMVYIIFGMGLILRLWRINIPLFEFYPSRQIQTAEVTRNLYRQSFSTNKDKLNTLTPTVSYLGPDKQPFLVEFPLYNFFVALIYKLIGGSFEIYGRIFSVIGWILSYFILYLLGLKYVGKQGSLIAVFFYSISPLSVLISRSFQPDQWMLTTSLASIYFADRWADKKKSGLLYLSAVLALISILIKITSGFFTLLPIAYLIRKHQKKWLSLDIVIFFLAATIPSVAWYLYASIISRSGDVLQTNSEIFNWFGFNVFLNAKYYANMFGFENNLVLLPTGIFLFLLGVSLNLERKSRFLYLWLGSVILYFLIFNKHNMTHEYYHLPLLPIASLFIGLGASKIIENMRNLLVPKILVITVLCIFLFLTMFIVTMQRAYKPIDRFAYVTEAAQAVKRYSQPQDLIIGSMDAGPALVYYSDRTGWTFEVNREDVSSLFAFYGVNDYKVVPPEEDLETLRSKGAKIFAAGNLEQFESNKSFANYMLRNYNVLEKTDNYIVFDIERNKDATW